MNLPYHLILGSKSPRRKELLGQLGFTFKVESYPIEETFDPNIPAHSVAQFLAEQKASAFRSLNPNELLLTSDTVVINDGRVMGKPTNRDEAIEMIQSLSNQRHQVVSGVALCTADKQVSFSEETEVRFSTLAEEEIVHYVDTFKPFDKAGAYGIQEWIGMIGVQSIKGDYYNVMGLPLFQLYQTLKREFMQ